MSGITNKQQFGEYWSQRNILIKQFYVSFVNINHWLSHVGASKFREFHKTTYIDHNEIKLEIKMHNWKVLSCFKIVINSLKKVLYVRCRSECGLICIEEKLHFSFFYTCTRTHTRELSLEGNSRTWWQWLPPRSGLGGLGAGCKGDLVFPLNLNFLPCACTAYLNK